MKSEKSKLFKAPTTSELLTCKSQANVADLFDLNKYCIRKSFYTIFLTETHHHDKNLLEKLIEIGQKFEDLSSLTFINRDEVLDLYKNANKAKLPPGVSTALSELCTSIMTCLKENQEIPLQDFARLTKFKLIQTMYNQYSAAVKKQRSRKGLDEDFSLLIKECKKSKSPTGKKDKVKDNKSTSQESKKKDKEKDKGKGKTKEVEKIQEEDVDYTTTTIDNTDDIVFEDSIYNCIWFYVFTGFHDSNIFPELTKIAFPISAIMSLRSFENLNSTSEVDLKFQTDLDNFWTYVVDRFYNQREDFSEDTILMKFQAEENINEDNDLDIYQKLLYAIRTIVDMKLNHLNYIRHIFLHKRMGEYKCVPIFCLKRYIEGLRLTPFESRNPSFVFNSLLIEVCSRTEIDHSKSEISNDSVTIIGNEDYYIACSNVFDFTTYQKRPILKPIMSKSSIRSFLCRDNDELSMMLNSYGNKFGRLMYDTSINMLNTSNNILKLLDTFENDYQDVVHTHNRDPSSKSIEQDEIYMHFLYIFLFSTFKIEDFCRVDTENELTEYLTTYDLAQVWKALQVKVLAEDNNFLPFEDNFYDTPVTDFTYKEQLDAGVLVQELRNAEEEFLYCQAKFSPETDNLLVEFHGNLDEFGVNVKIYEAPIRTPVCFRDYCRYIVVEEGDWITKNRPPNYIRPVDQLEVCEGLTHVLGQSKLFEEYYYLLGVDEETDIAPEEVAKIPSEINVTFDALVAEIGNFPTSSNLKEHCEKISEKSKLAYDFGTKYVQLTGCTTTFYSHDGVKLTVDNTRFLGNDQKCSANLTCRNNCLVMHSNKNILNEDFTFHVNLSDGTLVLFIIPNIRPKKKMSKEIKVESSVPDIEKLSQEGSSLEVVDEEKNVFHDSEVLCLDKTEFEKIIESLPKKISLNAEDDDVQNEVYQSDSEYNLLLSLKNAVEAGEPIYKVTDEYQHLQKNYSQVTVPLYSIVKRVLGKEVRHRKIGGYIKKYGEDFQGMFKRKIYNPVDFRITLPNGLYVTTYPSVSNRSCVEIKQEFLSSESQDSMTHEEFRLFSREGLVLIKKIDATILILKANGDIFEFETPVNTETVSLKPCHCFDINDYIKKLNKLMRGKDENYTYSRRVKLNSKKSKITDENILEMLNEFDAPYLKKNVLKFNGEKISIVGNKIRRQQKYATTEEKDVIAEEIFYERNDGFKCMLDRNSKLQIRFDDGTQISSIVEVDSKLQDGYVYVSVYFKYEHPNYATVTYGSENSFTVSLNNNVQIVGKEEFVGLNIDDDISISTTKEEVTYNKSCWECPGKFCCKFNITPFIENQWRPLENFLQVADSYNKEFFADFVGNCTRNSDYIKKSKNAFGCNHAEKGTYKKLFVINRNHTGEMFWTENMVIQKRAVCDTKKLGTIGQYRFIKNKSISVVDFRKNIHHSYRDRFLNNDLLYDQFRLDRYKKIEEKPTFYSTFRQIFKMLSVGYIRNAIFDIQGVLQNECCGCVDDINENLFRNVSKIIQVTEEKEDSDVVDEEEIPEPPRCECVRTKVDIKTKISNWRAERRKYLDLIRSSDIPVYFKSQFCMGTEE